MFLPQVTLNALINQLLHGLCVIPKAWYKHPVYTLHLIHLQGNHDSCMALYY